MNNYAVSSDGIATALQDSASALMEAGNSLEQATALVAAANKVVQDPSSVGSALRTISLRLRGTSVEILESMGEETEGVVESTSKLQEKLKALTGVDILTDAGAYKDTYTILREIGEVWENLDPMDQAAALELMAGKNRANTLAAILSNMEDLENAYKDALGAEGSAMRENEAYLDSIQGRIDLFNNAVQTMWMNFMNADAVKWIVNLGTGLVGLADNIGIIEIALAAILGYATLIKDVDWTQGFGAFFGKKDKTKLLKGKALDDEILAFNTALSQGPEAFGAYTQGAKEAGNGMDVLADKVARGNVQLTNGRATSEQYTAALQKQSTAAQQAAKKQKLMNTAVMLTAMAVSGIISAIQSYADSIKTVEERYDELQSSISAIEGDIASFDSELGTIQERIDELSNKSLTITEAEELQKLKAQSAELQRQKEIREDLLDTYKVQDEAASLAMFNQIIKTTSANQEKAAETGKTWGKVLGTIADIALVAGGIAVTGISGGLATAAGAAMMGAGMSGAGSSIGTWAGEQIGNSTKQVSEDLESWYESYATAIAEANKQAAEAEAEYLSNVTDDNYDKWQKKLEASNTLQQELYTNLEKLRGYVDNLDYNDTTKATIDGFNNLMTKISLQGVGDDAQSQIKHIQDLEEEFNELSRGVDANGKNIALSADEYARYQSILSQILGITPSLIKGYNDEGQAIVEKNNLIQQSIDLLKQQQQIEAQNLTTQDKVAESYHKAEKNRKTLESSVKDTRFSSDVTKDTFMTLGDILADSTGDDYFTKPYSDRNQKLSEGIVRYINDINVGTIIDELINRGVDISQVNLVIEYFKKLNIAATYNHNAMSSFKQTLAIIPKASDYYNDLSGSHIAFIDAYIDSLGDLTDLSDEQVEQIRADIFGLTNDIGENKIAQDLINSLFEVDTDLAAQTYVNTIHNILNEIVKTGIINEDTATAISASLVPDADKLNTMIKTVKDALIDEYDSLADNLSVAELEIAYKFVADKESGSVTGDQLNEALTTQIPERLEIISTYSELIEQATNYNEILQQTSEYVTNNTKVTKEYKESLEGLGISEEDIAKCFDDNNKLIVTNTELLNKLVKNAKSNIAANTKLAKSQARLQYRELYKEMRALTNGTKITDGATLSYVDSLYAQMTAIEKTIAKYSMLEAKLLGATNAYEQLEEAQAFDSEMDYGSKAEEMVNVLAEAFNTAELGTQAAQVAIAGLIPEDEINKAKTLDEQMQQIYDYFTKGTVSKLFTIEFDDDGGITSIEMTKENVQTFTEELIKAGELFHGTWDEFTLDDSITDLDSFADAIGVTKEVALAYLTELEKFDIGWLGGDYETLLDQLMSGDIEYTMMKNMKELADLEYRAAKGEFKGKEGEYTEKYAALEKEAAANEKAARNAVAKWTSATEQIEAAQKNVDTLSSELTKLKESGASEQEIRVKEEDLRGAVSKLYEAQMLLTGLEEPTEVMLQIVGENIHAQIKSIEDQIAKEGFTVDAVVQLDKESGEYKVVENHEYTGSLSDEDLKTLAALKTEGLNVQTLLGEGIASTETYLSSIDTTLQSILSEVSGSGSNNTTVDEQDPAKTSVKAYISEYAEIEGGAAIDKLSIAGLLAYVKSYAEITGGADVTGLTPGNLVGIVSAYNELTSGADISSLTPDQVTAYVSEYLQNNEYDATGLTPSGITAVVSAYQELETGADTGALNPTGLLAYVMAYSEVTDGADVSALTPSNLTAIVSAYKELASGADVSALSPDDIVAYISKYLEDINIDTTGLTPTNIIATVTAYKEMTSGALITDLTPNGIVATVTKYLEGERIDTSELTPDCIIAVVSAYKELANGADVSQLTPDELVAYVSKYLESAGIDITDLTPDAITATVNAYKESTKGVDVSKLGLNAMSAIICKYTEGQNVDLVKLSINDLIGIVTAYKDATNGAEIDDSTLKSLIGIITSYKDMTNGAEITDSTIKELVGTIISYQEATNGVTIDQNTLDALIGSVILYKDMTNGAPIENSTIKELVGIITSYKDMTNGSSIQDSTIKNLVGIILSYKDETNGAPIQDSELQALVGVVAKYEESHEGVSLKDLASIKDLEAKVAAYDETLNCDKSKLLQNFVARIVAYDDTGATLPSLLTNGDDGETNVDNSDQNQYKNVSTNAHVWFQKNAKAWQLLHDMWFYGADGDYTPDDDVLMQMEAILSGRPEGEYLDLNAMDYEQYEAVVERLLDMYDALGLRTAEGWQTLIDPTDYWPDINEISQEIQSWKEILNSNNFSNVDPIQLGLEVDATPDEIRAAVEAKLSQLQFTKALLSVMFGIELSEEDKTQLEYELNLLNGFTIDGKVITIETIGADTAEQELNDVDDASGDVTKTVTVHTEYTTGSGGNDSGGGGGSGGFVNGTAHAKGTAHKGGSWGAPKTETALTGELGPELRVRGNRWELLGENGAEFNEVKKGDIIFNHKQTEQLLSNGYITGRGKAFAEGTIGGSAYAFTRESGALGSTTSVTPTIVAKDVEVVSNTKTTLTTANNGASINTWDDKEGHLNEDYGNQGSNKNGGGGDSTKDAEDEFNELFDWIEVRIEEINEDLSLKGAKLENAIGSSKQNAVIDDMIELNQKLYNNLTAGASEYYAFAKKLLADVPEEYRNAAQDGKIAIEEFVGEVDEETLNAIQKYREWVQKGADATQQAEETLTEIQNLAKQAIDNIAQEYENKASIPGIKIEQLEAYNALLETDMGSESAKIYQAMIKENNKQINILTKQRNKMQAELNAQVEAGNIKKYSQAWYDAVGEIAAVDTEIINLTTDTENYQDAINELHWEHFDNLISRFEAISDEANNLIDILGSKDLVDEAGNWTDEGITSLGLYAQQMEVAEMQAKKYKEEIQYLNKNWKKLGYTEQEYVEKLEELKNGQYDAIKSYNDTKDAIVDLTKERVESIKDGIQKEIESYEKLIDAKKKELDAEKD